MKRVLLLGGAVVATLALGWVFNRADAPALKSSPAAKTTAPKSPRKYFLKDRQLADGTWLLLAPSAFRQGEPSDLDPAFRVVRDTDLLRASATQVWYDNDDSKRTENLLLSFIFLSPPANSLDADFAFLRNTDGTGENFTYYIPSAQGMGKGPASDLGKLVAASEPVFEQTAWVATRKDYDDLVAKIAAKEDLFVLGPIPVPNPQLGFARKTFLRFPSLVLPTSELTEARIAAEITKVTVQFEAIFGPPDERYDPLRLMPAQCEPPVIANPENEAPLLANDAIVELSGFSTLTLEAWLYSDTALADAAPSKAAEFGTAFLAPDLDRAIVTLVAEKFGSLPPEQYILSISCFAQELDAGWTEENVQPITFYQIGTDKAQ